MATSDPFDAWAASVMMVGFQGQTLPDELRRYVAEGPPAGVVLFRRNVESTAQITSLVREVRGLWPDGADTPLVALDQEGGKVRRLRSPECPEFLDLPSARTLGQADRPELTRQLGRVCGRELASAGFNLDFAPVLDVDSNPDNPVIAERSYGDGPQIVIRHALAFAQGLSEEGILPCGKHFPGHGDTDLDSHLALPSLPHDLSRLREIELRPFAAAVQAGLPTMMSAHIIFEALDRDWPATLSSRVLPTLLRQEMGFEGVVFSDDLEMRAIADHQSPETIAEHGLMASLDVFLVCHELEVARRIRAALAASARRSDAYAERLERAATRVQGLRSAAKDNALMPYQGLDTADEAARLLAELKASLPEDEPGL